MSILDIAEGAGVDLDHSCGGVCACSTCHVYVREGLESCNPASDDEDDQLDNARGVGARFPAQLSVRAGRDRRTWWSRFRNGTATWCGIAANLA